jgi:hypothetical protein
MPIHDEGDGLVLCEQRKVMTALILIGSDLVFLELTQSFIVDFLCILIDMYVPDAPISVKSTQRCSQPCRQYSTFFLHEKSFS